MNLDMNIVIYLLGLASTWGAVMWRISALEKKVDKHNSVIERTFELEKRAALTTEQIKVANHRIDDLERGAQM